MLTEHKGPKEHFFLDGDLKKQGEYKSWYKNGQMEKHCFCMDGKVNGQYRTWYKNGELHEECYCIDGVIEGRYTDWYSNGSKAEEGIRYQCEMHGEQKRWYESGELELHIFYAAGRNITPGITAIVKDIKNVTVEERIMIKIKFGIELL